MSRPGTATAVADPIRNRIRLAALLFVVAFGILGGRLVMFGATSDDSGRAWAGATGSTTQSRPDILDRNGEILATDIKVASLYAEPRNILDPDEAAELIVGVLPDLDVRALRNRLATNAGFAWIRREITQDQQQRIHNLGIPGIGFMTEIRRFYPGGPTVAHVLGAVNVDNQGIAGIEKYIDDTWLSDLHAAGFAMSHQLEPVRLSVDLRVQHILRDELLAAIERYHAIAASGIIIDVDTGEVVAMVSLPDYDPAIPADALQPDRLNRLSAGAYELGSVFKSYTFAMALDSGAVSMSDRIDATSAIRVGRHTINDFHGKNRVLTVPEVFIYSSNIGSARMALQVGVERQQEYLRRFGLLSRPETELPEVARPIVPARWSELTAMTVAFGHGLAVTPFAAAIADAALVNGGLLMPPTFLPRSQAEARAVARQVIKPETSAQLRYLLRLNAEKGSGRRAEVPGYLVGGKTGTAEKVENGRYVSNKRLNSFFAAFPMDDPRYAVLVMLDEPKPEKEGMGATAGLNTAPTAGAVIRRAAALLGVEPRNDEETSTLLVSN